MDPVSLAGSVVALIAPRLAKAGMDVARDASVSALDKVDDLVGAVRDKLAGDEKRAEALDQLETAEAGEAERERVKNILVGEIATDDAFAQLLERLVEESGAAQGGFNVRVGGANTGNITNIGPGSHVGNITAGGSAPPAP
ncbi:MAG: hypothetical protein AB7I38_02020 [Dehalococcoidia bacterium]